LLVLFSPGSAETDIGCGKKIKQSFDGQLYQKYFCQKLLKSNDSTLSYNRNCSGCFFSGHGAQLKPGGVWNLLLG